MLDSFVGGIVISLFTIVMIFVLGFINKIIDKYQRWRGTKELSLEEQSERRKKMMENIKKNSKK